MDKATPPQNMLSQPTLIKHSVENEFNRSYDVFVDDINPEFIERYQKLYEQDPNSKVFAPLAEAYRKMGLIKEALELAKDGTKKHPHFPGGRVALGRIYIELDQLKEAEKELRTATELSPENILAHQILAETLLKLKRPKEALRAYKMLLFLSPDNEKALNAVKKLESLTADEYEDDLFAMQPLKEAVKNWEEIQIDFAQPGLPTSPQEKNNKFLERVISLADAYIVRNDIDRAVDALNETERLWGPQPEVTKRLKLIHHRQIDNIPHPKSTAEIQAPPSREVQALDGKIEFLQDLLAQIKHFPVEKR
jgi:tetratricopeptide (TPR) repeat protein